MEQDRKQKEESQGRKSVLGTDSNSPRRKTEIPRIMGSSLSPE
jgi:hypothetical protein